MSWASLSTIDFVTVRPHRRSGLSSSRPSNPNLVRLLVAGSGSREVSRKYFTTSRVRRPSCAAGANAVTFLPVIHY